MLRFRPSKAKEAKSDPSLSKSATKTPPSQSYIITNLSAPQQQQLNLLALPSEIHYLIASHLNYPDRLSLRSALPYHFGRIDTGKDVKVAWIIERIAHRLPFPIEHSCSLRTDAQFNSAQVVKVMERWRRHDECENDRCVVGGSEACRRTWARRWIGAIRGLSAVWLLLGVLIAFAAGFAVGMGDGTSAFALH